MKRKTIKNTATLSGVGLHTGASVNVTFKGADAGTGIKFYRSDIEDDTALYADVSNVIATNRGTTLRKGEVEVATVEHLLSAVHSLGIDDLHITLDGPEVPIMDGSAIMFYDTLVASEVIDTDKDREYLVINEIITYKDGETGAELIALPSDFFEITTLVDFNSDYLGQQYADFGFDDSFEKDIAPARTFAFLHELELLFDQGLIKGGDLDNAVIIANEKTSTEKLASLSSKLGKDALKVDEAGVLNTSKLRYSNEPARHKLLDVIGDLSLVGHPIKGRIVATKPGHKANIEFAKILKKHWQAQRKLKGRPSYDPTATPVFNTEQVQAMLPHRYPFLMIDKIMSCTDELIIGVKNVTANEACFQGHFPGNAVFPGVLQMEALAQTGGILAINSMGAEEEWDTYFLKMDNVKFKSKVVPGDTIILKMELMSPIRRGIVQMKGTTYVGDKIASEGELTAQVVKRNK